MVITGLKWSVEVDAVDEYLDREGVMDLKSPSDSQLSKIVPFEFHLGW